MEGCCLLVSAESAVANSEADFDDLKINYFSSVSADICSDKLFLISSLDGEHVFSDIQSSVRWIFIFFIGVSFTNFRPSFCCCAP